MLSSRYLIVGGGMTADAAAHGIREVDPEGPIVMVGDEADPPYNRPPLSKALWKGDPLESIWRKGTLAATTLRLGCTIAALDLKARTATDEQGERYSFEKLLLATGGARRRLPFEAEGIIYFRSLADYRALRTLTEKGRRFAVI